jgi:hypothetical protein
LRHLKIKKTLPASKGEKQTRENKKIHRDIFRTVFDNE